MREFLEKIFTNGVGGEYKPYCVVHIIAFILTIGVIILLYKIYKNKEETDKNKLLNILSIVIIALYLGDFLTHPFAYRESDIMKPYDKLPFHLCTSCAILIPVFRLLPKKCQIFKTVTSTLGLIGGSFFMVFPSIPNHQMISYYVFQSFLYHMTLLSYSALSFLLEDVKPNFKYIYVNAIVILTQIGIAKIANMAYTSKDGVTGKWSNHNWYFIEEGSLGLPFNGYVMPIMVFIALMFGTALIFGIVYLVKYIKKKKEINSNDVNNSTNAND